MLTRLWYCVQDCLFLNKYAVNIESSVSRSESARLASVRCVEQSRYRTKTSFRVAVGGARPLSRDVLL